MNDKVKKIIIAGVWIVVWFVIALFIANPLVLASPDQVVVSFLNSFKDLNFWFTILFSFLRIFIGFIIALILGILLGVLSFKKQIIYDIFLPVLRLMQSAPIVCFIVLLLIWVGTSFVDIATVIVTVLPVYFFATYQACENRNMSIANMLKVHNVPKRVVFQVFEWPNSMPFSIAATKTAVGLSWKSGITAQMISMISGTIGLGVYNAKLNLDSSSLLMWMFVAIILSVLCEKLIIWVLNKFSKNVEKRALKYSHKTNTIDEKSDVKTDNNSDGKSKNQSSLSGSLVSIEDIDITFNGKNIVKDFSLEIRPSDRLAVCWPTGTGKTTIVNTILNLVKPDRGKSRATKNVSVVFQENTLLDNISIKDNISVVACKDIAKLDIATDDKPSNLSGGMKRIAQIERAIRCDSDLVIMDEPFTGLDDMSKQDVIKYINSKLDNRAFVLVTHDKQDAELLNCHIIKYQQQIS